MSKTFFTIVLFAVAAIAAVGQTREPSSTDRKLVIVRSEDSIKATANLKNGDRHEFLSESGLYSQFWVESKSNKIDEAEIHDASDDYHIILEGTATYVIGGKLIEPKELQNRPGEWRSAKVEGGERITVRKGDVLFIPRGLVHQRDTTGMSAKYQIIKIHAAPVEQRKSVVTAPKK